MVVFWFDFVGNFFVELDFGAELVVVFFLVDIVGGVFLDVIFVDFFLVVWFCGYNSVYLNK